MRERISSTFARTEVHENRQVRKTVNYVTEISRPIRENVTPSRTLNMIDGIQDADRWSCSPKFKYAQCRRPR